MGREGGRSALAAYRQGCLRRERASTAALRAAMRHSGVAWHPAADGRSGSLRPAEVTPGRPRAELPSARESFGPFREKVRSPRTERRPWRDGSGSIGRQCPGRSARVGVNSSHGPRKASQLTQARRAGGRGRLRGGACRATRASARAERDNTGARGRPRPRKDPGAERAMVPRSGTGGVRPPSGATPAQARSGRAPLSRIPHFPASAIRASL